MASLASDWVAALIGWDLKPLDSYSEFQVRLYRRLSQRSRLRLALPTSDFRSFAPLRLCARPKQVYKHASLNLKLFNRG